MREFQELKQDIANHREFREGEQDTWFEEYRLNPSLLGIDYAQSEARVESALVINEKQARHAANYGMGPKRLLQYTGSDAQRMRAAAAEITAKREARRDRVLSLIALVIGCIAVAVAVLLVK